MPFKLFYLLLATISVTGCQTEAASSAAGRAFLKESNYSEAASVYLEMMPAGREKIAKFHGQNISAAYLDSKVGKEQINPAKIFPDPPADATNDDLAQYYYDVGNYWLRNHDLSQAISYYEKALIRHPGQPAAAHNLLLALSIANVPQNGAQKGELKEANNKGDQKAPTASTHEEGGLATTEKQEGSKNNSLTNNSHNPLSQPTPEGTLQERLELLLGQQPVMIINPHAIQQEGGFSTGPAW